MHPQLTASLAQQHIADLRRAADHDRLVQAAATASRSDAADRPAAAAGHAHSPAPPPPRSNAPDTRKGPRATSVRETLRRAAKLAGVDATTHLSHGRVYAFVREPR